jgi:hypothetical protein
MAPELVVGVVLYMHAAICRNIDHVVVTEDVRVPCTVEVDVYAVRIDDVVFPSTPCAVAPPVQVEHDA